MQLVVQNRHQVNFVKNQIIPEGKNKNELLKTFNIFSNGGFSFLNTPIGKGQTFLIPSSVKSSSSYKPRAALKKSATTENVTNYLLTSDSSDPPSTIIKSCQKKFKEFGSDERKIISGFLSTPLLVIKTPGNSLKDLPRSPLQKVTTKKSNLGLFSEESSFLVRETSSVESTNETLVIEETLKEQSSNNADSSKVINTDSSNVINAEGSKVINSSNTVNADSSNIIIPNTSLTSTTSTTSINSITQTILNSRKEREHESFQATVKARILEERERIESQAAFQARKLQKLKAGPTSLPVKSTKPLTVPIGFQLGCDERAQLKKLQSKSQVTKPPTMALKVIKPTISQKFTPTIPKSPLFASKLRAAAKAEKEKENAQEKEKENIMDNTAKSALDLRKKLEYRPVTTINRNRILNTSNASNNNSNKN